MKLCFPFLPCVLSVVTSLPGMQALRTIQYKLLYKVMKYVCGKSGSYVVLMKINLYALERLTGEGFLGLGFCFVFLKANY